MILTAPRFVKVDRAEQQLDDLFGSLIGGRQSEGKQPSFRRELRQLFRQAGLLQRKVLEDVSVQVPRFEEMVAVPYAFQNGKFNLIQPVRFAGITKDGIINRACKLAVEGESIHEAPHPKFGPMQLFLLAKFAAHQKEELSTVRAIMKDKPVRLLIESQTESLIDEIRTTGRDISPRA